MGQFGFAWVLAMLAGAGVVTSDARPMTTEGGGAPATDGSVVQQVCRTTIESQLSTGKVVDSALAERLMEVERSAEGRPKSSRHDLPMIGPATFALRVEIHRTRCDEPRGRPAPKMCDVAGCEEDVGDPWDWDFAGTGDRLVMEACGLNGNVDIVRITRVWVRQSSGRWKLTERTEIVVDQCVIE